MPQARSASGSVEGATPRQAQHTQGEIMSDELLDLLIASWKKIQPLIDRDPDELARRLARRRTGMLRRPPRAWCLAVRASDQRINPATAAIVPEDAAYPHSCVDENLRKYPEHRPQYAEHEVTLDAKLMR